MAPSFQSFKGLSADHIIYCVIAVILGNEAVAGQRTSSYYETYQLSHLLPLLVVVYRCPIGELSHVSCPRS
jgi:hypothetical protein